MAIQGNLSAAPALFAEVDSSSPFPEQELAGRFRRRFLGQSEPLRPGSGSPLVDEVTFLYRQYWSQALMHPTARSQLEIDLETSLAQLVGERPSGAALSEPEDDLFSLLGQALQAGGFHVLFDAAPPLQDMFIWRHQHKETFTVELTDQTATVEVVFMNGFVAQGWKNFATVGLATTSGWVQEGILFCLSDAYTVHGEAFRVSYLKHESRHLMDLERYPHLSAQDLEYRAKLTELAFAQETLQSLIDDFAARGADNPSSPHALANHRVIKALQRELSGSFRASDDGRWTTPDAQEVNRAARRLLERHTQGLESAHASR